MVRQAHIRLNLALTNAKYLGFYTVGRERQQLADRLAIDFHLTCVAILNLGGGAVIGFEIADDGRWVFNLQN